MPYTDVDFFTMLIFMQVILRYPPSTTCFVATAEVMAPSTTCFVATAEVMAPSTACFVATAEVMAPSTTCFVATPQVLAALLRLVSYVMAASPRLMSWLRCQASCHGTVATLHAMAALPCLMSWQHCHA